jgi:peroxiredoxin
LLPGVNRKAERWKVCGVVCLILLSLSIAVNVTQGKRLLELAREADSSRPASKLTTASDFSANDLNGVKVLFSFGTKAPRPRVLYIFSPECSWCERNSDAVNSLASQIRDNYEMVGVSVLSVGLKKFVRDRRVNFPVYEGISTAAIEAYRLQTTPETFVISPDGRILADWKGAYIGLTKVRVERFFRIVLP